MTDDEKVPPDTLKRLKTGALARRWQLSRASMQYGRRAMSSALRSRLGGSDERQQADRQANIDAFVQELGKLKGSIVKIGQIMATYGDYLMPPEVVTALHRLEDNTPPHALVCHSQAVAEGAG